MNEKANTIPTYDENAVNEYNSTLLNNSILQMHKRCKRTFREASLNVPEIQHCGSIKTKILILTK